MKDIKQLRKLRVKALAGNKSASDELIAEAHKIVVEANRKMRELKSHGADYGATWSRAINFTNVMYDSNRFKRPSELDFDIDDVTEAAEEAYLFVSSEFSDWRSVREMERQRKDTFASRGWIPDDISDRRFRNFLRFLGNEETQNILQDWTSSDDVVEMLYDAYSNKANSRRMLLSAFSEYNETKLHSDGMTFNELMDKFDIDVSDYPKKEWF